MDKITTFNQISRTITRSSVGTSDSLTNIPNPTTIAVIPTGGSSAVEYTLDPDMITWVTWPKGVVTIYTDDVLVADVIAIRLRVDSGTAVMQIVGGRHG